MRKLRDMMRPARHWTNECSDSAHSARSVQLLPDEIRSLRSTCTSGEKAATQQPIAIPPARLRPAVIQPSRQSSPRVIATLPRHAAVLQGVPRHSALIYCAAAQSKERCHFESASSRLVRKHRLYLVLPTNCQHSPAARSASEAHFLLSAISTGR